jgi:hypothetical protein
MFESFARHALAGLSPEDVMEKGEYVVVLDPGRAPAPTEAAFEAEVRLRLAPEKEWAKAVASRYGVSSSDIYNSLQRMKKNSQSTDK